jgi:hypothetical protein
VLGTCTTHPNCATIADLAAAGHQPQTRGRTVQVRFPHIPATAHELWSTESLTEDLTSLRIIDRNAYAMPAYGPAKHTFTGNDPTFDRHWSNGRTKTPPPKQQPDGLLVPWGHIPSAGRVNRENELNWLIATGPTHAPGVPHGDIPCQHGKDIATDLNTLRAAGNRSVSLASSSFADDSDDGPTTQVAGNNGTPFALPDQRTQRQIEHERWSTMHGRTILKVTIQRNPRTGAPSMPYWMGWAIEPQRDAEGTIVKRGTPKRIEQYPPEAQERLTRNIEQMRDRLAALNLSPSEAHNNRLDLLNRAAFYGKGWQWSLLTPRQAQFLRTRPDHEVDTPTFFPQLEDETQALYQALKNPHATCKTVRHLGYEEILHEACLDYGTFRKQPDGRRRYVLNPDIRLTVERDTAHGRIVDSLTLAEYEALIDTSPVIIGSNGPWASATVWDDPDANNDGDKPITITPHLSAPADWMRTEDIPFAVTLAILKHKAMRVRLGTP